MPGSPRTNTRIRGCRLIIGLALAACLLAAGASGGIPISAAPIAPAHGDWVLYNLPGTRDALTVRWELVDADGNKLVIKMETYINGQLRATKEVKRERLPVPEQCRRETIVAGGRKYDCRVFQVGSVTYWYSEDVPVLGIVRTQDGNDVMDLVDSSVRPQR